MKVFVSLLLFATVIVAAVDAHAPQVHRPNGPKLPTFPGHGPFNPHPYPNRPMIPNFPGKGPFNPRPIPNRPTFPIFPGQGPFNPRPHLQRFRRSPQDNGKISVSATNQGGGTSWSVEGQKKIWSNDRGSIYVSGGANRSPGGKPQPHIGIGGSFQWG